MVNCIITTVIQNIWSNEMSRDAIVWRCSKSHGSASMRRATMSIGLV